MVTRVGSVIAKRPPVRSRWSYEIRSLFQPSSRYQGAGICGATLGYSNHGHHPQERAFRERRSSCLLHREVVRSASVGHAVELEAKRAHLEGPRDSLKGAVSSREVRSCIWNASRSTFGPFSRLVWVHHAWVHDTKHVVLRGGTSAESPKDWHQGHSC